MLVNKPVVSCKAGIIYADMFTLNGTANGKIELKDEQGKLLATIFVQDGEIVGGIINSLGNEVLNPAQMIQYGDVCNLINKV